MIFCMSVAAPSPGDGAVLDGYLARIAAGEQDALADLYHKTRPAVYGFALSILKNEHDAYLQIWQAAGSYQGQGKPMAWILTITRNLALSRLRQQSRTEPLTMEDWQDRFADRETVSHEDRMALSALLAALEDTERQIVALHALSGLKHREIAEMMKMPLPTVLSKYHRAMKKLRLAWKEAQ